MKGKLDPEERVLRHLNAEERDHHRRHDDKEHDDKLNYDTYSK